MSGPNKPTRQDYIKSIVYLSLYVIVIGGGAWLLLPNQWVLWAAIVLIGMLLLVGWHKKETAYRCPNCEHVYQISFLTDLTAPHGDRSGWRLAAAALPQLRQASENPGIEKNQPPRLIPFQENR